MQITERLIGNDVVLRLQGKLTGLNAGDLLERAVDRIGRAGRRRIVLDLNEVSMIDAGGLASLAGACRASLRNPVTLTLAHVPKRIHTLIALARLTAILATFDSVEDALNDASSGGEPASSGVMHIGYTTAPRGASGQDRSDSRKTGSMATP